MSNNAKTSNAASISVALERCKTGNYRIAAEICQKILSTDPENFDATHLLGGIALRLGDPTKATELLYKAITLQPNDANARMNLGRSLYELGRLEKAASSYRKAIDIQHNFTYAKELLHTVMVEINQLDNMIESFDNSAQASSLRFSEEEKNKKTPDITTVNRAEKLYRHFGYLIIEDLFSEQFVSDLYNDFESEYPQYLNNKSFDDALDVGDKRIMLTVKLQGAFNNSLYYANPLLMPLLSRLLGNNLILLSHGAVRSLPGAKRQHTHRDHIPLFEGEFTGEIPSFAVTLGIPLIDMNEVNGTTRVYGKSHKNNLLPDSALEDGISPTIRKGSCMLFDYRLLHEGTPNNSSNMRPLMYNIYSRPWFRDCQNYSKQNPLQITEAEFSKIPEEHHYLFTWSHVK